MYELKKLGVTTHGDGRWHVDAYAESVDETQQLALHEELLSEYQNTLPGLSMEQVRMSLACGYQIRPAYRDDDVLQLWCVHEQQWHAHPIPNKEIFGQANGRFEPQCVCSASPLKAGYVLHEIGKFEKIWGLMGMWPNYGCATCDRPAVG